MYKQPETEVAFVNTARMMQDLTLSATTDGPGKTEAPARGGRTMFED